MGKSGQRYHTIEDIAKEFGVSKTTVSRAISGKGRISKETREKIRRFISEHNYRPNVLAKGLAQNKTFNIGLAMPEEFGVGDLPFFQKCINGICQAAAHNDYDVILFRITADLSQLKRIINNHKVDGIILTRTVVNDYAVQLLKENGTQFVVIGSSLDTDVTHVDNDHAGACKMLTELLLGRGLRSFALIGGNMDHFVNKSRLSGFQKAFEDYPGDDAAGKTNLNVTNESQVIKAVDDALAEGTECIVCMDDFICSRVMARLTEHSLRVPDDVSIATFYSSMLLEHNNPLITGLEFDAEKLGGVACQMLIGKLEGVQVDDYMSSDYRLFIGNSTK
ncbi:MAG: LacI family DNA-binding transcriptional regulator [Christensenellales bacterium]